MRRRVKTTRSVSDTLVCSFGALVLSIPLWSLFYAPSAVSTTFIRGPTRRSFGFLGHRQITHGPCLQGRTREHSREHSSIARSAVFSVIAEEVNNRPGFFFGEVLIIVVLSAGFEKAERWLRKKLKASGDFTGGEILDALFREITILGFIGLLLFVLTHLLPEDSPLISLGADEYNILPETFEYVHMATFLLLVVLLFQGFAVLRISRETAETWADYESTRAFGTNPLSMESLLISEGYLERRVSSESPAPDSNLALDESKMELRMLKPFTYGGTVIERASLRRKYIHKLIMWRAVRHGFLFEGAQSKLLSSEGVIPGLFSFEVFLEQQLSQIVLSLVEVDVLTWFYALLLVALVTLICLSLESVNGQAMQCICCWALAAVAFAFSIILEEDTYELTPQVPVDPRQILRMFSGTSIQMIRRASFLDISQEVAGEISRSGRRFRPQLPGVEGSDLPRTQEPSEKSAPGTFLLVPEYTGVFKLLCFLQAAVVASLLVNLLNGSVYGWDRVVPYLLAWAEWPLMLFVLVPDLVRRLTVRAAVTRTRTNNWFHDKQRGLVKRVMISGIEGLLRDCTRLIHLQGMEARAVMNGETWAQNKASAQAMTGQFAESLKKNAVATAKKNVKRGAEFFDQLQPALKTEVFSVFSSWDARNAGAVAPFEPREEFELRAPRDRSRSGELRFTGTIVEEPGTSNPRRPEVELPFRDRAQTENPNASSSGVTRRRAAERINSSGLREVTPDRLRRGEGPGVMKTVAAQIRGFYLLKFAVSVTACYLTIQLLRKFAEVLLPFIFAVLVTIILEPLKKFVMRVLCRLVVRVFLALHMDFCVDGVQMTGTGNRHPSIDSMGMEGQPIYGSLPEDSEDMNAPSTRASMPAPTVKKLLIALSIFYCLAFSARVFWLVARVFLRAAAGISQDMQYYKEGAARLKSWMKEYISGLHIESLDFNDVLDELLHEVENLGTVLTQSLLNFMVQGVVTFIFLIYMLWSPVKMDGSAMATEAFHSTSRYLKVKFGISAFTGLTMGLLLFTMGLDLPAAFGLLSFLCNFLPGIGSLVASIMPCMLSIIDVRKAPMQVAVAFIMQMFVHFLIDFLVEPVVFGISVEMNSVIVILGIWFFYQVWGVPGMLLSVPLLAVVRIMIKSVKFPNAGGDDDTAAFFDGVFAGRWMSSVGEPRGEEDIDDYHSEVHPKDEGRVDATAPVCGEIQRYEDLWTMLMESQLAQELRQMYLQRQLTYDFGFLVFITLGLTLIQV